MDHRWLSFVHLADLPGKEKPRHFTQALGATNSGFDLWLIVG